MDKFKRFTINIDEIIPQQHFLSKDKLDKVTKEWNDFETYGDIFVIQYKGRYFSVDGHHRLYQLFLQDIEKVDVVMEYEDNDNLLYRELADQALALGFTDISSLKDRIIEEKAEYEQKWVGKCQTLLKELYKK